MPSERYEHSYGAQGDSVELEVTISIESTALERGGSYRWACVLPPL
jgi:hypothetical protein